MCGQFDYNLRAIDSTDVIILVNQTELTSVIALPEHVRSCRRTFLLLNNVLRTSDTWRSVGRSVKCCLKQAFVIFSKHFCCVSRSDASYIAVLALQVEHESCKHNLHTLKYTLHLFCWRMGCYSWLDDPLQTTD
jgi:hypothetical protein